MQREPTLFEQKVYAALSRVPSGKIVTYKTLGLSVGCNSGQAIGNAMRRNPYAPRIPCHRVIPASLSIGGYSGQTSGEKIVIKRKLLESEGVFFSDAGKLLDQDCLIEVIP